MTRKVTVCLWLALAASVWGCRDAPVEQTAAEQEPAVIAVTTWTSKTELFMEYPPLVAGEQARFAIHLTDLSTFKPIREGRVVVRLEGDTIHRFEVEGPSTPGIFGVNVQVPAARRYQLVVELHGVVKDEHRVGAATVHPDRQTALAAQDDEAEEGVIAFLKEQQWTLEFATVQVDAQVRRGVIDAPATVEPRPGGSADVRAPVAGRVVAAAAKAVGTGVARGESLVQLIARNERAGEGPVLKLELAEAETAHRLARENLARTERLVSAGATPQRRLAEARAAEETAAARVRIAQEQLRHLELTRSGQGTGDGNERIHARAPITGVIAEASATPGANVEEGQLLFRIVALDRVHIAGAIPEQRLAQVQGVSEAEIVVPGITAPLRTTRLVSVGRVVQPETRAIRVTFELTQPPSAIAIGQAVTLRLITKGTTPELAVPANAVVDDAGQSIVFVQAGGESFERRPVKVGGTREGGFLHIAEGLESGDRVVTRGAHLVRLAALSPRTPGHGHVH
jgi:RND family efflux transporter MFP subunit